MTGILVGPSASGIWSHRSLLKRSIGSDFSEWSCEDGAGERCSSHTGEQHVGDGKDGDDAIKGGEAMAFMLLLDDLFPARNFNFSSSLIHPSRSHVV